jgi:hypothetical protein
MHGRELARPHAVLALRLQRPVARTAACPGPPDAARAPPQPSKRLRAWRGRRTRAGLAAAATARSARSVASVASAAAHARPRPGPLAGQEARGAAEHLTDGFEMIG